MTENILLPTPYKLLSTQRNSLHFFVKRMIQSLDKPKIRVIDAV